MGRYYYAGASEMFPKGVVTGDKMTAGQPAGAIKDLVICFAVPGPGQLTWTRVPFKAINPTC